MSPVVDTSSDMFVKPPPLRALPLKSLSCIMLFAAPIDAWNPLHRNPCTLFPDTSELVVPENAIPVVVLLLPLVMVQFLMATCVHTLTQIAISLSAGLLMVQFLTV